MKRRLPKRPPAHVIGEQGVVTLRAALPAEWIIRELDKDYGIDCEIEITNVDGDITGALIKAQIKGTTKSRSSVKAPSVSVSTDTVRYWVVLPVPVIIIYVFVGESTIYWLDVREYLADRDLLDQIFKLDKKSISFVFNYEDEIPDTCSKIVQMARQHQESTKAIVFDNYLQEKKDLFGGIILIDMFDFDPVAQINRLVANWRHEQLLEGLPYLLWIREQLKEDPKFEEKYRAFINEARKHIGRR